MSVFCQKSFRKRCVGNRNSFIDFMTRPSPLKPSTVVVACLNSAFLSVIKIQRLLQGFGKVEVIIISQFSAGVKVAGGASAIICSTLVTELQ